MFCPKEQFHKKLSIYKVRFALLFMVIQQCCHQHRLIVSSTGDEERQAPLDFGRIRGEFFLGALKERDSVLITSLGNALNNIFFPLFVSLSDGEKNASSIVKIRTNRSVIF
ncbi:hypothetical protein BTM36_24210 [Herbaspirillum sp. VT-16-41]|nr:hypothetical protein BTM36_24210 [Herbaspirillum sp. VT-16-41]